MLNQNVDHFTFRFGHYVNSFCVADSCSFPNIISDFPGIFDRQWKTFNREKFFGEAILVRAVRILITLTASEVIE